MAARPNPARVSASASSSGSAGFHTRAMPEVRNPVYAYNQNADFKRTPQPQHALERPSPFLTQPGVDRRRTVRGDKSRATDLTPVVGMAYQSPYNVWALYPA